MKNTIGAFGALSAILLIVPVFAFAAEITTSALVDGSHAIVTVRSDAAMPDSLLDLELYDAGGNKVRQSFMTMDIASGSTSCDWSMSAPAGDYTLKIGIFKSDWSVLHHWNNDVGTVNGPLAGDHLLHCGSGLLPTFSTSVSTSGGTAGEIALFTTIVQAGQDMAQVIVDTEVYDLADNKVAQWWETRDLAANTPVQITHQSMLPGAGMYKLKVGLFASDWSSLYQWNDGAGSFTVAASQDVPLILTVDPSSPGYKIVAGSQADVTMGVYRLHAFHEAVLLEKIGLKLSSGSAGSVAQVRLYDGLTLVGTAVFASGSTTTTSILTNPVYLPQNSDKTLTVKADLANIGIAQPGKEGDLIAIDPLNAEGIGQSSGEAIQVNGTGSVAGVRVFKGYPTITLDTLPAGSSTDGRLMRFKVTASPFGDINLYKFTFEISTTSEIVSNIKLLGFTEYGFLIFGQNGQIGSTIAGTDGNLVFTIDPPRNPLAIPAGGANYFELWGTLSGTTTGSTHSITLKGDTSFDGMKAATDVSGNFIWSPNATTSSGVTMNDWTNAFGISGLPASGLTQTQE